MHNNSFERMPTSTPKPRRRWHQFSLRTLLVAILFCLITGWVAYRVRRTQVNRDQTKAVKQTPSWIVGKCGFRDAIRSRRAASMNAS